MELKKEFTKYSALRKQHDMELIKIAHEAGIRFTPEQWSQKFYGDAVHKSDMQSIIDKLQSQLTLDKLLVDFYEKLAQMSAVPTHDADSVSLAFRFKPDLEHLASINFEKRKMTPQATPPANQTPCNNVRRKSSPKRNSPLNQHQPEDLQFHVSN